MTLLLEARNLRVDYGEAVALREFSLRLSAGNLLGLVGPNGAGKTTAMRAIAGMLPLVTGEVRLLGQRVEPGRPEVLSQIGFTPDTPALYDALSVSAFLEFVGRSYGLRPETIEERTGFWLDELWLSEKRSARVGTLSRGMRQRLNVARTLMANPALILLDEPAAGLDPAGRVEFRRILASLRDQGKALIVSSHILADLHEYCTHIAIMESGRVRALGTVAEVIGRATDHRCRYRGVLAEPRSDLAGMLAGIAGVFDVSVDGVRFGFEFDPEPAAAARLLRELVTAGLPVAAFEPVRTGLEEAYLRAGIRQVD